MYERSAIVLERCFERLFKFNQEHNLRENYENFCDLVEQVKEYQKTSIEEETIMEKFDEIASKIESIQKEQTKLHESNMDLEQERDRLFNDVGENPNALDSKLRTIEKTLNLNNEKIEKLRQDYVEALVIFVERQKERNKYARLRRKVESNQVNNIENATKNFEEIETKDVHALKRFITADKQQYKERIINTMIKNGKNEKIPFNNQVIKEAVEVRIDIAEKEADIYISIYDRMKRLLMELESESVKLAKSEKMVRDAGVKLKVLQAKKEYIVGFLDNERLTAMNGQKTHDKIMEQACKDFKVDIKQIDNLYELIIKETNGKSTKKAYNELYNKTYLRDIEQKERKFEKEITGIKINMGTVINSSYWRIEGIKNVYNVFQEEVTEKFNKDLSEYKVEEYEEPEPTIDEEEIVENQKPKTKSKTLAKAKKVREFDDDYDDEEDDLYRDIDDFDFGDNDDDFDDGNDDLDDDNDDFDDDDDNFDDYEDTYNDKKKKFENSKKDKFNKTKNDEEDEDDEKDNLEENYKDKKKQKITDYKKKDIKKLKLEDLFDDDDDDDDFDDEDNDDFFDDDDDDDFDYDKYDKDYSEGYKEDYSYNYKNKYDDDDNDDEDDYDYDNDDDFDDEDRFFDDDDDYDDEDNDDLLFDDDFENDDDDYDSEDDYDNSYHRNKNKEADRSERRRRVNQEFFDENIDRIIMKSRQKLADKQEAKKDKGLLNKLFKKKN